MSEPVSIQFLGRALLPERQLGANVSRVGRISCDTQCGRNFPDPAQCWHPGSPGKPDLNRTIFTVEAALEIPPVYTGSIIGLESEILWQRKGWHLISFSRLAEEVAYVYL